MKGTITLESGRPVRKVIIPATDFENGTQWSGTGNGNRLQEAELLELGDYLNVGVREMEEWMRTLLFLIQMTRKDGILLYFCVQKFHFISVQSLSRVQLFAAPWIAARQASLSITNSWSSQTHVHQVGDAIQPSHPLSSPSPPAPNRSQHQGLFQWVNSAWGGQSIGVSASASVLPMNTQDWSPLGWTSWISLQSKGVSRVFCNTTVQKHQFFGTQLSSQSNSHILAVIKI